MDSEAGFDSGLENIKSKQIILPEIKTNFQLVEEGSLNDDVFKVDVYWD